MKGVHGDQQTADGPEHAIFDAANYPNPAFGHLIGRGGSDQQMDEGDECDILQVDAKKQADTEERLNRSCDIHPGSGRLEAGFDEKLKRRRYCNFSDDMWNEKHRADNSQKIEFVEQIEFVGKRHGAFPHWVFSFRLKLLSLQPSIALGVKRIERRPVETRQFILNLVSDLAL